jgi:AraC family transcriptional regulator
MGEAPEVVRRQINNGGKAIVRETGRNKVWAQNFESLSDFYAQAYPAAVQASRRLPVLGAEVISARQGIGDWSGAPLPMLSLIRTDSPSRRARVDVGAGRFDSDFRHHSLLIVAPGAHAAIEAFEAHRISVLSVPYAAALARHPDLPLPADGDFGICHAGALMDPLMSGLLARTASEARSASAGESLFFDSAIAFLLALMCRLKETGGQTAATGQLAPWQVRRVTDYLRDRLSETVTLAELASITRLSSFHFARAFKASTGYSPYQFQVRLRMERAKELLESGRLPVTGVALSVGYATPQAFARAFRVQTGMTPGSWRRRSPPAT